LRLRRAEPGYADVGRFSPQLLTMCLLPSLSSLAISDLYWLVQVQ
jgi:hypothetical protein